MNIESKERISRIRDLNDAFRRTFSGGRVMMACGVDALPDMIKARALLLVSLFDRFSEGNDPHGSTTSEASTLPAARSFGRSTITVSGVSADRKIRVTRSEPRACSP